MSQFTTFEELINSFNIGTKSGLLEVLDTLYDD